MRPWHEVSTGSWFSLKVITHQRNPHFCLIDEWLTSRISKGVDLPLSEEGQGPRGALSFRHSVVLTLLQSRVYNQLYSAKSFTKSETERLALVGALDEELEQWRNSIPITHRPGHEFQCHDKEIIPVMCTQFRYFDCLITIHRASTQHCLSTMTYTGGPSPLKLSEPALNPRVFNSMSICVDAARSTIQLLENCARIQHNPEMMILRLACNWQVVIMND